MAISRGLKEFYTKFWEAPETFTANVISKIQEKRKRNAYLKHTKIKLSAEQKKEIKEFWKPYKRVSPKWALYHYAQNGIFSPKYIPADLYFTKIDQHFNSRRLGYGFNDKNYYSRIFSDITQPKTIVRKIAGLIYDADYSLISAEEALSKICSEAEVIVKPSQETGSGRGIRFWKTADVKEEIISFLKDSYERDYIIQGIVKQHPDLAKPHPSSLNTVRIATILLEDGVHILSSVYRMGVSGSRVDNASAGGISVGINPDGTLKKTGYHYFTDLPSNSHPDGLVFEGYRIPSYAQMVETVTRAAQYIGNFRLVSWDLSADENGEVILIEANMRKGGIKTHQVDNGPMFGEVTEKVLNEVFKK